MKMPDTPRLIFWELTKRCNLTCKHCRAEAADIDFSGELDTGSVFSILDDIADTYSPILVLTGGEPLYREDIFEITKHAVGRGLRVALATNGTLIDEPMAVRIAEAGVTRVSISLDGPDAASHDDFRGLPGSFDSALEGGRHLRRAGVPVQINTTITKRNEARLEEIVDLARSEEAVALHLFMLVPVGCGAEIAEEDMLSGERYEKVLNWFYERSKRLDMEFKATCAPHYYRIIRQRAAGEGRKLAFETDGMAAMTRGCLAGSGVCFISHRGDVQPCGYLPLVAGNVTERPFREIWETSELFLDLRNADLLKGKCGACGYRHVCGGCRARAYFATGDPLDEEPYCAYEPERSKT